MNPVRTTLQKWVLRFVCYSYDELDTTHANIYDVLVTGLDEVSALAFAREQAEKAAATLSTHQPLELLGEGRLELKRPDASYSSEEIAEITHTPTQYCSDGETYHRLVLVEDQFTTAAFLSDEDTGKR